MAGITINHLCTTARCHNVEVAYLFCNYKGQAEQSSLDLLSNLLKQLIQARLDIAAPVIDLYKRHIAQRSRPSIEDIFKILRSVCSSYTTVYIVIDAFDEYADMGGQRNQLIDSLRELQINSDVRFMVTSRFTRETLELFRSNTMLEVRASEGDVRQFVAGQMPRLPKYNKELEHFIEDRIAEAVKGMFLLARLYIELLRDKRRKRDVLSTLSELPKASEALDQAYNKAVHQIEDQPSGDSLLAKRAIRWVAFAQRPLTTEELCHALSVQPGDKALDNDDIYSIKDVITVCVGLLVVDERSNVVRLVHYTTQDYFERSEWKTAALEEIAVACLTYLSFDTFKSGRCANLEAYVERLVENRFLTYSARYWSEHIRLVERSAAISDISLSFLRDKDLVDSTVQAEYEGERVNSISFNSGPRSRQMNGLHLTARFGLPHLTKRLLSEEYGDSHRVDVGSTDSGGRTPLSRAAENGHEAVVRILLDADNPDPKDVLGNTPLLYASMNGHTAVVQLLLGTDKVDPDSKNIKDETSLLWASGNGHTAVVQLLLSTNKVDPDSKDTGDETPLLWASINGHTAVVQLLLGTDKVDPNSKNTQNETPLLWASGNGHTAVVQLFLSTDKVNLNLKDIWDKTPLSFAAKKGHEAVVRLLLGTGKVDINSKHFSSGRTPLSFAAKKGHEAVVRLLLGTGKVDINSKHFSSGRTPLSYAAQHGHVATVQLLLNASEVDVNLKDNVGRTALWWAAGKGHEAVVRLLLSIGEVDINVKDSKTGMTALDCAVARGHEIVAQLLRREKLVSTP
ncbi:MAG: hypothetical protein M1820_010866 [Bogoriella megaspora]|nr:MAG: hypothetical protein M1820_010866 [Bogoriella megaspora]